MAAHPALWLLVSWLLSWVLFWLLLTGILAWNGFLRIYLSSVQLGIKWRVLFLLLWWAPVLNLILLGKMCAIVREEYRFETEKEAQNQIRRLNESCKTRYPIVLVHGVFFRDRKCFNYWGRIPGELIRNGAVLFYGGQQSAAATKDAAEELTEQVLQEGHVFITPGFIFGTNGSRYVRISLCADVIMLKNALKRIQDLKL